MDYRYEKEDLQQALRVLREGGVILYPTDTIWGIGCDATNAAAVARVYAIKKACRYEGNVSFAGWSW
jgi:L-threonylcarbamoyladenylate synthase